VTNVAREVQPQNIVPPKMQAYPANYQTENYYKIPVSNYSKRVNANPRPERFKIFSNYQTQPSTSFISNQQVRREEYYG
jgi:hypothetical protein